jgi:iron complex outermembrane recepter protein
MRSFCLLVLSLVLISAVKAQQISGSVKAEDGKNMPGASVALKRSRDSMVVKMAVTNAEGGYQFINIANDKYFVTISHIGYVNKNSPLFDVNATEPKKVPDVVLYKSTDKLKAVEITSQKPLIEVRADRTIFNVEGSINAIGNDALDLLRKSPGVIVDKDENILLSGKNGLKIYIDGRPTPLSGEHLSSYLKSLQSASIEAIEIITNPGAKYDAAGNAGIINIKLKKNQSYGTNGSVNAGFSQGVFPKYIAGISLNRRNKKLNIYGNYNYNKRRNESSGKIYREQLDSLFDQQSTVDSRSVSHNFKAGLDYFISKRSTLGFMANGNLSSGTTFNYSRTPISYIPTGNLVKTLVASNESSSKRDNINLNINYRYTDTKGRELNADADYGIYRITGNQLQPNYYYDPAGNLFDTRVYNMIAPVNIDMATFKTDYEQNFKKGRLGLGFKISNVKSNNDFQRYNVAGNDKTLDTLRSNLFNYSENINAVYGNYFKSFKGFSIQIGLRVENTNASGYSNGYQWKVGYESYDSTFKRNYTDFFPSAALTFNKNKKSQFSITYSRRIDRPAYQDLNPFEFKLDEYTFQKGNTSLRPQYTQSFGISHTYKFKLTTRINYSHVKDIFTQMVDTLEKSKAFIIKRNLATQDIISFNINYMFQRKWYNLFANINSYYSRYKADFGTGRIIDLDVFTCNFYAQQVFKLNKIYTAEMSGYYNMPSVWQGTFKTKEVWGVDVGLQRIVLKGNGSVKAAVSDVFRTSRWRGSSNFAGQFLSANGRWESRLLKLTLTYRFGNNQVKANRQRKSGLEDENKRVGSQGEGMNNL